MLGTRRIRVGVAGLLAVLIGAMPMYAGAAATVVVTAVTTPDIFITEIQTNGGSASQEFIELYNDSDQPVSFNPISAADAQWQVQFFNSTSVKTGAPTWNTNPTASTTVSLMGTIAAHDYFLLATTDYHPGGVDADQYYAASSSHLMTDTGGGLQLLSKKPSSSELVSHDRVMWLAASAGATLPAGVLATPAAKSSLQREPNEDMEYSKADGPLTDFIASAELSPLDAWRAPTPVVDEPQDDTDDDEPDDTPATTTDNNGLTPLQITELLPNPGSPLTDAADEFIELYNPNNAGFSLKGYSLQVGTTTKHTYVFTDNTVIPPASYQEFYASETKLSLSNSGGQAQLLDASGTVLSETEPYGAASDNEAWIVVSGSWQWTTVATPGRENVVAAPVVTTAAAKAAAAKATKAAAAKTTTKSAAQAKTAAKAKTAKVTKAKKAKATAKKKVKKAKAAVISTAAAVKKKQPIHRGILVAVVVAALLYALYEYRHDISDKFRQFGENRAARGKPGTQLARRRGYSTDQ